MLAGLCCKFEGTLVLPKEMISPRLVGYGPVVVGLPLICFDKESCPLDHLALRDGHGGEDSEDSECLEIVEAFPMVLTKLFAAVHGDSIVLLLEMSLGLV